MASSSSSMFLFFILGLWRIISPSYAASYTPVDNYLIACGSSGRNSDELGRSWTGDISSALLVDPSNSPSVSASSSTQDPNLPSSVPYLSARIFPSPASYSFPVTRGRHWLRLHFYPFSFESYDRNNAIVTVKLDSYSLITNMSLVRQTEALNFDYIVKEYSINVTSSPFTVSFIPGSAKASFAMVNGIELVSMPDDLFPDSPYYVDAGITQTFGTNTIAFETMYRLNVGGQAVTADTDPLSRTWSTDIQYIPTASTGVSDSTPHNISYGDLDSYTAPQSVYQTARTMTGSNNVNLNYNLTWNFSVDTSFIYYVRLHFCEFEFSLSNQRVFNIYIDDMLAENEFDVIAFAKTEYTACYKDYATVLSATSNNVSDLIVQVGATNVTKANQYNAILNGLEVFKMNDSSGNLQGPPPPLINVSTGTGEAGAPISPPTSTSKGPIIGGVAGAAAALALLVAGLCCLCRRKKKVGSPPQTWPPLPLHGGNSHSIASKFSTVSRESGTGSYVSSVPSDLGRQFTFMEISEITNNFDEARVLGVGGFGKVYEGVLEDGTKVAVKRGNPSSDQGVKEFQTEIDMLSKLRHRHLVSLIGYCKEHCEMILVYDYMANGPLRGHLYGTALPPLSWKQRLEICIGAARGLHYLHTGAAQGVIHRDVKTTNILLDENLVAKVSDFGLSKTGPALDQTHVSTAVKGSFGYLDPEYFRRQQLTEKSDVYSFGVVLMEVLCARPVINPALPREQVNLAEWAMQWKRKGLLDQIIDRYLLGKISSESLKKFGETAEKCLLEQASGRPAMGDVLWNLEYALQLHESSAEKKYDESNPQIMETPLLIPGAGQLDDSSERTDNTTESNSTRTQNLLGEDSDDISVSAVFSQLVNPQGR